MINTLVKEIIYLSPTSPVFKGFSKDFALFSHINFTKIFISVQNNTNYSSYEDFRGYLHISPIFIGKRISIWLLALYKVEFYAKL